MKVTELTKEIYDKYQKVYENLVYFANSNDMFVNELCYCKLEDFFEENGIVINIFLISMLENNIFDWISTIKVKNENGIYKGQIVNEYKSKIEAKQKAILKAC